MTVYSLSLNKGDYAYSIAYHQGYDDLQLDTNEEALNSMKLSIEALTEAIRSYAVVDYSFNISLNKVKFGAEGKDYSVSFTAKTFSQDIYPQKVINMAMSIKQPREREKEINKDRAAMLLNIDALKAEVERYLNGERAQSELSFEDDLEEEADVEIEDIVTAGPADDDTPYVGDIDLFD